MAEEEEREVVVDQRQGADSEEPIFATPIQKARKTLKVTKGGGPATKAEISFQNLTVTVKNRGQQKKTLLNNVSGYIPVGDVLMIMGSSGCGKSKFISAYKCSHTSI